MIIKTFISLNRTVHFVRCFEEDRVEGDRRIAELLNFNSKNA
jgi:hypothetical protein